MKKETNTNKPSFIPSSHNVNLNTDYEFWLNDLKSRYQRAQIKAAIKVNSEKLLWNWQLGRDLVERRAEEKWGSGIVEQLSLDLKAAYPQEKGFGTSNLWAMKQWYIFYSEKLHQLGGELPTPNILNDPKLSQLGTELSDHPSNGCPFPTLFAYVPWRHHVEIITKCDTLEEALFYIYHTITEGWSRSNLQYWIKEKLYFKQGGAILNFTQQLPAVQAELAQEITKDNYDFSFISLPP